MGNIVFRMFGTLGVAAVFEELDEGGEATDPSAPRNGPAVSPEDHLDRVRFSTALDILEVASVTDVTINHDAVSSTSSSSLGNSQVDGSASSGASVVHRFGTGVTTHDLVTHDLGYVPDFLVVVDDQVLTPGRPVQTLSDGRGRYCTAYATTTKIILHEWASVTNTNLPAVDIDYRVLVLREPRDASGNKLFEFDPDTGVTKMGFDRFSSDRRYLQVVPGGSPFSIPYGKTLDLKNGAIRFVNPDGTYFEPAPVGLATRIGVAGYNFTHTGSYGSNIVYDGDFEGTEQILVQAP